jgi:hypothetical protein
MKMPVVGEIVHYVSRPDVHVNARVTKAGIKGTRTEGMVGLMLLRPDGSDDYEVDWVQQVQGPPTGTWHFPEGT